MKDLPQNELLSAYLDGELTAAEQANVERLLAANPSARQTLDELRALSSVLQSLPQQKLGEDLSALVLRVAERRMLTEGEPDAAAPRPAESLPRWSINFRRFINRRSMLWTGLAVGIAVIIAINERNEQNRPSDKELAHAKANVDEDQVERRSGKPREYPALRPASDSPAKPSVTVLPKEAEGAFDRKPAHDEWTDQPVEKKLAGKALGGAGAPAYAEPPSQVPETAAPAANGPGSRMFGDSRAAPPPAGVGGLGKAAAGGASGRGGTYAAKDGFKGGPQFGQPVSDVLVVYCDISPEAAKKKSFAKLLDANGIEWQRHRTHEIDSVAERRQSNMAKKGAPQRVHDEEPALETSLKRAVASGKTELVYAEATPAQVRAALAGLEAQPNVFLSFSIRPLQDATLRQVADHYRSERGGRQGDQAGDANNFSGFMGQARSNDREATGAYGSEPKSAGGRTAERDKSEAVGNKAGPAHVAKNEPRDAPPAAAGAPVRGHSQAKADATPTDNAPASRAQQAKALSDAKQERLEHRQDSVQSAQGELFAQSPPRQRVLFVLRIGGAAAAVAAEAQSAGGDSAKVQDKAKADATKPAKSPPAEPVPSK